MKNTNRTSIIYRCYQEIMTGSTGAAAAFAVADFGSGRLTDGYLAVGAVVCGIAGKLILSSIPQPQRKRPFVKLDS